MIKFLIQRPIAVLMAFYGLLHSGVGDVLHITGIAVAGYLHSGDYRTGIS